MVIFTNFKLGGVGGCAAYRVSRKKVYPLAANLVNIKYKDLAHLSYTIG